MLKLPSLLQIGLLEMKPCCEKTGGMIVLADSFGQSVFKESLRRMFRRFPDDSPGDGGHLQVSVPIPDLEMSTLDTHIL